MPNEYWLGDKAWATIEPLLPNVYAGARRHDDRRIISGIIHVLRSGCRWKGCPAVYGPYTTVYNRFNRWSGRGRWQRIFDALVAAVPNDSRSIDSTSIKVQRSAAGGKGGASKQAIGRSRGGRTTKIHGVTDSLGRLFRFSLTAGNIADITPAHELAAKLPSHGCLIGDMGYDAKKLRVNLAYRGTATVIPTNPTHKHQWYINQETYKDRNLVERAWCRIKDFRRIATRYDKLARNFASSVALAAIVIWWSD
jgi:transposase